VAWNVAPDLSDSGFPEASKWFRQKLPVTDDEWAALGARAKQRAFNVGGVTQLELVQEVWTAVDTAVAAGTTLAEFQDEVGAKLANAWGGADPFRLETAFRTNVQAAFNAGRYEQQNDPGVLAQRPWWKFSAILDSRTTPICAAAHGTTLPANDPWWQSHQSPCHFNCRSTVISLTDEQATRTEVVSQIPASPGFGAPPAIEWSPDISKFSPELADALLRRTD
jgi:SPP1 gp7 family putative phage head morphogenesis protein